MRVRQQRNEQIAAIRADGSGAVHGEDCRNDVPGNTFPAACFSRAEKENEDETERLDSERSSLSKSRPIWAAYARHFREGIAEGKAAVTATGWDLPPPPAKPFSLANLALARRRFVPRFRAVTEISIAVLANVRLGSWARQAKVHPIMPNTPLAVGLFR